MQQSFAASSDVGKTAGKSLTILITIENYCEGFLHYSGNQSGPLENEGRLWPTAIAVKLSFYRNGLLVDYSLLFLI